MTARKEAWRKANKDRHNASASRSYFRNKEKATATRAAYQAKNKDHLYAKVHEYQASHKQQLLEASRKWHAKHPGLLRSYAAKRRAQQLRATPSWADLSAIKAVYAEAARLTKETGVQHHVDHIFPLRSKLVCGLHIHTNLQVLTATDNLSKSNRHWPGEQTS